MKVEPCTRQPVNYGSEALETKSYAYTYILGSVLSSTGGTVSTINLTTSPSGVLSGDIVRITSGTYTGLTFHILSVVGSVITLAADLPAALANGTSLNIERWVPPLMSSAQGGVSINIAQAGGVDFALGPQTESKAITVTYPTDRTPVESWFDDFSSQRWGNVMMGVEANLSSHPVAVDSIGNLIVANATNSATTALTDARGKIDGPSITNTYSTLLSMSGAARHLALWNSTDQNLLITYDNGTTDNVELDAGEFYSVDFIALGTRLAASTIKVKWLTAVPKFGSVRAVIIR